MRVNLRAANDACIQDFLQELGDIWILSYRHLYSWDAYIATMKTLDNPVIFRRIE